MNSYQKRQIGCGYELKNKLENEGSMLRENIRLYRDLQDLLKVALKNCGVHVEVFTHDLHMFILSYVYSKLCLF